MKCFVVILLLALFAVAFCQTNPVEPEKLEPEPAQDAPRDKRGTFLAYTAPYTYPYLPYAYSYRTIPYSYYPYYL
ncbi:uncharacterized protein LOC122396890 [Colletes gigas]|uniref:uncharacterized protein LOC122396890 n=1 Tax=Colletes gigas TaxID=935657 RepID=UPI001C9B223E|nr:uncharacterized protein LOC122396890 [Colletes gigas]